MKIIESFLEKGWGDSVDNPQLNDLKTAIEETKRMDDEHGAFWISIYGDEESEVVLEVEKNLRLTLILDPENLDPSTFQSIVKYAESWEEVFNLFKLLLAGKVDQVKDVMNIKS